MIYLACDHNGVAKMEFVKEWLTKHNYKWEMVGAKEFNKTDSYVDYVKMACPKITENDFGVFMCGTGVGVSIMANRFKGIRAVLCNNAKTAYFSRIHNNANVICFSGGYKGYPKFSKYKIAQCLNVFLSTKFDGGRHSKRVEELDEI